MALNASHLIVQPTHSQGGFMRLDIPALLGGLRTAGALLIGNSVLVFSGVIGTNVNAESSGLKIFLIGATIVVLTCFTKKGN
jgi:hypothetical protein